MSPWAKKGNEDARKCSGSVYSWWSITYREYKQPTGTDPKAGASVCFFLPGHGATCEVLTLKSPECLHLLRKMSSRRAGCQSLLALKENLEEPGSGWCTDPRVFPLEG